MGSTRVINCLTWDAGLLSADEAWQRLPAATTHVVALASAARSIRPCRRRGGMADSEAHAVTGRHSDRTGRHLSADLGEVKLRALGVQRQGGRRRRQARPRPARDWEVFRAENWRRESDWVRTLSGAIKFLNLTELR